MAALGAPLFDETQVLEIRTAYAGGETAPSLSRRFGSSVPTILKIARGQSYKAIGGPIVSTCKRIGHLNHKTQITSADVIQIRDARSKGVKCKVLAEKYGVHASTISEAANGKVWMHIDDMPPPFRLTKNGPDWMIEKIQDTFPGQAFVTPALFIETLCASQAWFSRMCDAGKLKTEMRHGVRVIRMRDAISFIRTEYGEN